MSGANSGATISILEKCVRGDLLYFRTKYEVPWANLTQTSLGSTRYIFKHDVLSTDFKAHGTSKPPQNLNLVQHRRISLGSVRRNHAGCTINQSTNFKAHGNLKPRLGLARELLTPTVGNFNTYGFMARAGNASCHNLPSGSVCCSSSHLRAYSIGRSPFFQVSLE